MASLNFLERNAVVRELRAGKEWPEAIKALPLALQKSPTLEKAWRGALEAEAKQDAPDENKPVKLDPDEFLRLREQVKVQADDLMEAQARIEQINSDLAAVRAENEALKKQHSGKR